MPTTKIIYLPAKIVSPVYSSAQISRQKRDRAEQKAVRQRDEAEIEASRKKRAAEAAQQVVLPSR